MNLLVLTSSFPRYLGDHSGNFVNELVKKLQEKGLDIVILAPHQEGAKKYEIMDGMKVYRFPYFYPIKYQRLAYGGGIPSNLKRSKLAKVQAPLMFLSELYYSLKIVKKEKINIINSHWLTPQGLVGAICKKILGTRHIATIHSSEVTFAKKIPAGRKIMEFIVNNSDTIVSVSSHRANELQSFIFPETRNSLKKKCQIIPMGINLSGFMNKIGEKYKLLKEYGIKSEFIVLFVGRLVEVKGCEYLIKGFRAVVDNFDDVQLIIVGLGPLDSYLEETVKQLDIAEHVRFEGFVEHGKICDYYRLSNVIVLPSIVDSLGCKEGMPIVLLEAFAAGKPIIATRTGGFIEAIEDGWNGLLVEPKNAEQITEKILEILKNQELRTKLSENALESSKKYDWNIIVNKYLEIFRNFRIPNTKRVESI